MIGKNTLEIGAEDFVLGMTTSPDTQDGGFSNESTQINIQVAPGVLHSGGQIANRYEYFNGDIIATCGDAKNSGIGNDKIFVSDTAYFYTYDGTTTTQRQTGVKTYIGATTDIIQYKTDTFCTSDQNIARLIQTNLSQPDANWESWWTITQGKTALLQGFRHPMVIFEDSLWIADGRYLHKWDGTTATHGFLTLSSEQSIVSLCVDPSSGKMLIGTNEAWNAASTKPAISKVLTFNGYSNKPDRAVIVDDMVTAMYPLGGIVYMCYGNKLGYWVSTGIAYLRTLKYVTYDADYLVYKHQITNIGNTLYVADTTYILAYGEVLPGKKVFYYTANPTHYIQGGYISALCFLRGISAASTRELGIFGRNSSSTYLLAQTINSTTTLTNGAFYSKRYKFQRPIQIRGLYVEYGGGVANNLTPGACYFVDTKTGGDVSIGSLLNDTGVTAYDIYTKHNGNKKVRTLQFKYTFNGNSMPGIKRFIIDYDVVE